MQAKAVLRYVRVTPRKARLVLDLIRGKNAEEALTVLRFTPRHAAEVIQKVLRSAVANAAQKDMGDLDALRVSSAFANGGPTMKRVSPRAMGRANTILKRTSHITLVLEGEAEDAKPKRRRPKSKTKTTKTKQQKGGQSSGATPGEA